MRQAHGLTADLTTPDRRIYWLDLALTADWAPRATHSAGGPFRADQWVRLALVVQGDHVAATAGGHTLETTDPARHDRPGPLVLGLGGRDSVLEVRMIEIKELPADR